MTTINILNVSPLVPTTHCTDARIEVKMLSPELDSGRTEHRLRLSRLSSIPETPLAITFLNLSDEPSHPWTPALVLHALYRTLFHYILVLFLDLRLQISHFQQNDRQNDTRYRG